MATIVTHGLVGAALASPLPEDIPRRRVVLLLALLSAAPDLDVLGYWWGVPYGHPLGHRGLTHSLPFAACVGLALGWVAPALGIVGHRLRLAALGFIAVASHGVLDAMTDAGLGIGFLIPFDNSRYFLPWRPLLTSPLSLRNFFEGPALRIFVNECLWIWLPLAGALAVGGLARRRS